MGGGANTPGPRRWRALDLRDAALLAALACGVVVHGLWAGAVPWAAALWLAAGLLGGAWLGRRHASRLGKDGKAADLVANDIQTLHQAFGVLKQQVRATIDTSEAAVMSMMERMNRVHQNTHDLRARIMHAVERSQSLSSDSLDRAGQHGQAVSVLAEHQSRFEQAQAANQARVRVVAERVRQLSPLAALIDQIARQTNLLAINASIEAARAGPEGAGFKVVATEVRRLSTQTSEAALQITQGIEAAAASIDAEMASAEAMQGDGAAVQLGEIAQHIQAMSVTLSDVVPYLGELSGHMDSGMAVVTEDIINTLGDMQFQDINRQLLEQISAALTSLSDHFAQLYQLIDGRAPPPPVMLEELLARWTDHYVMHSQRVAHALGAGIQAAGGDVAGSSTSTPLPAPSHGPRIELF